MITPEEGKSMTITEKDLEAIGRYVQGHLPVWLQEIGPVAAVDHAPIYTLIEKMDRTMEKMDQRISMNTERIIRVEEELKSQRELMKQGFEQVDKRFEQVDKRFEQVDKRFEQMDKRFEQFEKSFTRMTLLLGIGFTMLTALMSIYKFMH